MYRPLAIDLYTGLSGWAEGLVAEGYDVVGIDLEDMCGQFGLPRPAHVQIVLQDVRTLHGSQFRAADLLVASPPCQEYSYMSMPWTRAKQIAAALRGEGEFPQGYTGSRTVAELTALFDACFRIQREACEAAGRHIPLIVENVKGAQLWVGRARWNFGSYYLWGDVPALMPVTLRGYKNPGFRFDGSGKSFQSESVKNVGVKAPGMNWSDQSKRGQDFTRIAGKHAREGVKQRGSGAAWFDKALDRRRSDAAAIIAEGKKCSGAWFGSGNDCSLMRQASSKSPARKFASAMIAKIPFVLSRHIAATFKPSAHKDAA